MGKAVNTNTPLPVGSQFVAGELAKIREGPHRYRLPDPVGRWHIEYYRDPAHRGYLSHRLQPGESPSLYFKVPGTVMKKKAGKAKKQEMGDQKLF